ncbi:nucleoside deaminase [Streptomyces sp. ET3-23]|uniref:nucleoside deaminase n=1 Tax=Streptomyces sp. ET3-23 TaxID=2885643 RepID=UPI001D11AB59|nr:nucleoside deaminase [Streptomyces sp. ET3-23]MCC2274252.1 nucleoside deaminase [Streptomyces sp. ET3-23]
MSDISTAELAFLQRAVAISRRALEAPGITPFGALVVVDGAVVGEGSSSVVKLHDPTAHAEVMALRAAGAALERHILSDGVMYTSSEPCPMCLTACYWAHIPRVVYAADSHDVAEHGFEDLRLYRELRLDKADRTLQGVAADGSVRAEAVSVLKAWSDALPEPVVPKF